MAPIKTLIFALAATLASSEPPVPYNYHAANPTFGSSSYLPPTAGYNPPSNNYLPPNNGAGGGYNGAGGGYNGANGGYNGATGGYGGSDYDSHGHGHESEVPKSYEFGYSVKDAQSGNDYGRQETSDGNTVRGEYRVALPDGRVQIVTYHADWKTGFHADVRYEGEARYPEPQQHQQNGYNYESPDYSGSLHGFNSNSYNRPSSSYGSPGYH